jgi:hypothetical protein
MVRSFQEGSVFLNFDCFWWRIPDYSTILAMIHASKKGRRVLRGVDMVSHGMLDSSARERPIPTNIFTPALTSPLAASAGE